MSLTGLMLMDLHRAGDEPDSDGLIPAHDSQHNVILEEGEQVVWTGRADKGRAARTVKAAGPRAGFSEKVWSSPSALALTITNRRVIYRVEKIAKLELGTGYVLAGAAGMLAQKAITSIAMRNMTAAGHVRHRWLVCVAATPEKRSTALNLYLMEPDGTFFCVTLVLRGAGPELAPYLVQVAAADRLERCAEFGDERPDSLEALKRQRDEPATRQGLWGQDYALVLSYQVGGDEIPFNIAHDRKRANQLRKATEELDTLAASVARGNQGVRTADGAATLDVHGFAFTLPPWWNGTEDLDTTSCERIGELNERLTARYGSTDGGPQHWREALKAHTLWSARKLYLPIGAHACYLAGGLPEQAVLLAVDYSDFVRSWDDSHRLYKIRAPLGAPFNMQAARGLVSLGLPWSAHVYAERAAELFRPGKTDDVNHWVNGAADLVREIRTMVEALPE